MVVMTKRKSPRRHIVRAHKRGNVYVRSYVRGKGPWVSKSKTTKPVINRKKKAEPKGYTVIMKYSDKPDDKEEVKVIATSYQRAIDEAFEERKDSRFPIEVRVIDPSLGEIFKWASKRALELGKKAAAYAKEKASEYQVKRLIADAYSQDPVRRAYARAKLRKEHPEIWDVMDISRR